MGILNVTPDSFSDGGKFRAVDQAVAHALEMARLGADIIDVGGESTRPGAAPVPEEEERARIRPVVEELRRRSDVAISIDTSKAGVAREALRLGADIVNDVTGLRGDPAMARVAAEFNAGVVLMHMRGEPRSMQDNPTYEDVLKEVAEFLDRQCVRAIEAGVARERIAIDPGVGFGKTLEHNLALLRGLPCLGQSGRPILLGVSRKSFLGKIVGGDTLEDRAWPTVALTSLAIELGARILRVHDVKPNVDAARMTEAILWS